jgi:hypothetical protein
MCIACIKKRIKENRFKLQQLELSDRQWPALMELIKADELLLEQLETGIKTKGCC